MSNCIIHLTKKRFPDETIRYGNGTYVHFPRLWAGSGIRSREEEPSRRAFQEWGLGTPSQWCLP